MEKKRSATASGEDYLEAVLVLQKEKGMVRSVDVARHMGVSKPSVCHAVVTLKKGGFLTMDEDLFLRLTDIGREVAEQTYEKHCFFTHLLMEAGVESIVGNGDIIWKSRKLSLQEQEQWDIPWQKSLLNLNIKLPFMI